MPKRAGKEGEGEKRARGNDDDDGLEPRPSSAADAETFGGLYRVGAPDGGGRRIVKYNGIGFLEIRPSTVYDGPGLFALQALRSRDPIISFGTILDAPDDPDAMPYMVHDTEADRYWDGSGSVGGIVAQARTANELSVYIDFRGERVPIWRADRDIERGEELLADYGGWPIAKQLGRFGAAYRSPLKFTEPVEPVFMPRQSDLMNPTEAGYTKDEVVQFLDSRIRDTKDEIDEGLKDLRKYRNQPIVRQFLTHYRDEDRTTDMIRYYLAILMKERKRLPADTPPRDILNNVIQTLKGSELKPESNPGILLYQRVLQNQMAEKMVFEARGLIPRYLAEKMIPGALSRPLMPGSFLDHTR